MDSNLPYRPRVSRETRLLLTTALVAVAALWVLARIRFPDLPVTPNPVSPLLSQLTPPPAFDGLASEVSQLQSRLEPALLLLDLAPTGSLPAGDGGPAAARVTALRVRDALAITLIPTARVRSPTAGVVALDRASGLGVVRVPVGAPTTLPPPWTPRRLERPRFLLATDASTGRVALRPIFIASLEPVPNALWPDPVWMFSPQVDIAPGSFLFTTAGELAGLVIDYAGQRAVVPPAILLAQVDLPAPAPPTTAGPLGIDAQPLTPELSSATGATAGVVVTWVDNRGPAAGALAVGDVIEAAAGRPVPTLEHWGVRLARLGAGETLVLRVRRNGELRDARVTAPAPDPPIAQRASLGLRMRRTTDGTEILAVEQDSAAARAGLAAGDVITVIRDVSSPTPVQTRTAFATAPGGTLLVIGVTRGATHFVTTLTR